MSTLLIALVLATSIECHETKCQLGQSRLVASHDQMPDRVMVVADGSPGPESEQVNHILGELETLLAHSHILLVARFDAEPVPRRSFAVRDPKRDLVMVKPQTPMRDAMEMGFALLMDTPRPHRMVVVAREQFYPSAVPASRLLELARNSETKVFTIHVPTRNAASTGPTSSLKRGFAWIVERFCLKQRAYSPRETAGFLKMMSEATGGAACVVEAGRGGSDCAAAVAVAIDAPS